MSEVTLELIERARKLECPCGDTECRQLSALLQEIDLLTVDKKFLAKINESLREKLRMACEALKLASSASYMRTDIPNPQYFSKIIHILEGDQ